MLLTIAYITILYVLFRQTKSKRRRFLSIILLIFYLLFTIGDLFYLNICFDTSFHPSDPTTYYNLTKDIDFTPMLNLEGVSNLFYLIINWFYNHIYGNTFFISLFLKINNVFLLFISYLLLTRFIKKIYYLDIIILLNPYLLLTVIRNVRDLYIILFVSIIIIGFKFFRNNEIKKKYVIITLFLLFLTRPMFISRILYC